MSRAWRHLFIAFALLFAQQAAQLHALTHVRDALSGKSTPPASHLGAKCLAFHAVDSALPCGAVALEPERIEPLAPAFVALPLSRSPRIEFDSRAPPTLS
jgi:hypothetical protein